MAALGPRVWKKKMKARDGICRKQMLDRGGNFESCDPGVRQTFPINSARGAAHASKQALEADEIDAGVFGSYCGKKGTIAAAEIDFDRCKATEDRPEIESPETISGDERDLTCYG
jgi:hypothetical protein